MSTFGLKGLILIFLCSSVSAQSLEFEGVQEVSGLKRGKEYSIRWSGGTVEQKIEIALMDPDGGRVQKWSDLTNDGEHTIKLDSRLKPGRGYVLDITITGTDPGVISSSDIRIKRRIPLALTASVVVVVPLVVLAIRSATEGPQDF